MLAVGATPIAEQPWYIIDPPYSSRDRITGIQKLQDMYLR